MLVSLPFSNWVSVGVLHFPLAATAGSSSTFPPQTNAECVEAEEKGEAKSSGLPFAGEADVETLGLNEAWELSEE